MGGFEWGMFAVAVIAAVPGILAWVNQRKKTQADVMSLVTEAAGEMVNNYRKQVMEYQEEVAALTVRVDELEVQLNEFVEVLEGAHKLHHQVVELQHVPVYIPPPVEVVKDRLKRKKGGNNVS